MKFFKQTVGHCTYSLGRSSQPEVLYKEAVLKKSVKLTENKLRHSLVLIKVRTVGLQLY